MLELFLTKGWVNMKADGINRLKYGLAKSGSMEKGSRLESLVNALRASDESNRKCTASFQHSFQGLQMAVIFLFTQSPLELIEPSIWIFGWRF
jgi:hypothetical protein